MATRKPAPTKPATPKKPAAKRAPAKKPKTEQKRGSSRVAERRAHNPEDGGSTPLPATTKRSLTEKEAHFVAEYLIDPNATQAYAKSHKGVTGNTARVEGSKLLTNPDVRAAIDAGRQQTMSRLEITRERVLLEAARLAFFDPRRLYHPDGQPKQLDELDDDTAACIAGVEVLEEYEGSGEDRRLIGQTKKWKVAEKNPAVERLFKHLGLFEKDNSQKQGTLGEQLAAFLGQMHTSGAARLPIVAPKARQAPGADDRSTLQPKARPEWK